MLAFWIFVILFAGNIIYIISYTPRLKEDIAQAFAEKELRLGGKIYGAVSYYSADPEVRAYVRRHHAPFFAAVTVNDLLIAAAAVTWLGVMLSDAF